MFEIIQAAGVGLSIVVAGWSALFTFMTVIAYFASGGDLPAPDTRAGRVFTRSSFIYGIIVISTLLGWSLIR